MPYLYSTKKSEPLWPLNPLIFCEFVWVCVKNSQMKPSHIHHTHCFNVFFLDVNKSLTLKHIAKMADLIVCITSARHDIIFDLNNSVEAANFKFVTE